MRVAVIGATGVLGRALIPLLAEAQHRVVAVARTPEKARALYTHLTSVEVAAGDLLAPAAAAQLRPALHGCTAVIHAATAIPRLMDMSTPGAWEANTRLRTEGVARLLEICRELGIGRYLQQSITMAYPDRGAEWIDETLPLDTTPERAGVCAPVIAMEQLVQAAPGQLTWCILRGGEFVGPDTFQELTLANLAAGRETITGAGDNYLSLIHVADMAAALAAALIRAPAGAILNIVDEPVTQKEYKTRLAARLGAARPAVDPAASPPPSWRCHNQAARSQLGWSPRRGIYPG